MTAKARRLRREATYPERLLWSRLRGNWTGGIRFRRQHPIGPYVAYFYCAEHQGVIELDGRSHEERMAEDERRTHYLEGLGLRVIRFSNDEVVHTLDWVLGAIEGMVTDMRHRKDPHPNPSP